jgi:hypothetical protein
MKKHETPSEKAACYLAEGYNCAQNVLLGVYESWHDKNELVPKVATAFGSGIGQCCSVCGAVMVIGIKYGTNDSVAKKRTKATIWHMIFCTNSSCAMKVFSVVSLSGMTFQFPTRA